MPKPSRFNLHHAWETVLALFDERLVTLDDRFSRTQRFILFWTLVWRSFVRNRCPVRASALSYTTLLSLIPLLAIMLGITGVFLRVEGEERIDRFIEQIIGSVVPPVARTNDPARAVEVGAEPMASTNTEATATAPLVATYPPAETNASEGGRGWATIAALARSKLAQLADDENVVDARKAAAKHINEFIQKTRSGTLGATGMVLLLWAVHSLLARIEETMNDIWGAPRGRNWLARVLNYWAAITLGPMVLAFGLGLASGPRFAGVRHFVESMPFISGLVFNLLPLLLLWLAFTFFYQLMPNTKVRFGAAAIGGLVGGALWLGNNLLGSLYISRVVTNFKIYGSLGLVPVFMLGLYFSWLILLFGAQVAYAWQNRQVYLQDRSAENVNQRGREFVALRLMTAIGQRFQRGSAPPSVPDLADELSIPTRLVQQVTQTLVTARLVNEVAGHETAYVPARPLETMNCHHILQAMRAAHGQELATRDEPARTEVFGEFARIQEAEKQAATAVTMLALVNRAQARLELTPGADLTELKPALPAAAPETNAPAEISGPNGPLKPEPEPERQAPTERSPSPEPAQPPSPESGASVEPQPSAEPKPPAAKVQTEAPARPREPFMPEESPFPD